MTIIFDHFDSWKFAFVNPIYQFPRALPFIENLLNFEVKNEHLVFLIIFLNCFQFSKLLVNLYFSRFLLQFISHQLLKCFVMLIVFEFFIHILFIKLIKLRTTFSSCSMLDKSLISMSLKASINSLTNILFSLLFLTIICFLV